MNTDSTNEKTRPRYRFHARLDLTDEQADALAAALAEDLAEMVLRRLESPEKKDKKDRFFS